VKRARVLLADDHIMVSQGLRMLLKNTFDVVASVTDGRSLVETAKVLNPDVIVTDISMPVLNGMDAVRELRSQGDDTKVIFVTMHSDARIAIEAFRSGATGYVLKHAAGDELIAAIHAALQGGTYLTPLIARDVLQLLLSSSREHFADCTDREREVLEMVAQGLTPTEMADRLNLSVTVIESDLEHVASTAVTRATSSRGSR
jgi:DNA-binding NarL/FixJ family response regulator